MALSDVTIMRRGGANPIRLNASAIRVSWEVNAAGTLSCDLATRELIAAGLPLELESYWIEWQHPTAGGWGGQVMESGETSEGTFKVAASGYATLMERRFCVLTAGGNAGALLRDALSQVAGTSPTYLSLGAIHGGGPAITMPVELTLVYEDLLPHLIEETGYEWDVSASRVVRWLPRIGSDKRGSVRLAQGLHIASYQTVGSRPLIENVIFGLATTHWSHKGISTEPVDVWSYAADQTSINRHGRLEGQRDFGLVYSEDSINDYLRQEIAVAANPPRTASLTLVQVGNEWATFAQGDTVRLAIGEAAVEYDFRIMVRTIDVDQGVMELNGEATRV